MTVDDIRMYYQYNSWANNLILDAAANLEFDQVTKDVGTSHVSIFGTLYHLFWAESLWLARWKGKVAGPPSESDRPESVAELRGRWESLERDRAGFISTLTDDALAADLDYADTKGNAYRRPLGLLMHHCANHSTLHRGQIMSLIRMTGTAPPKTDFLYFLLEQHPA